MRIVAYAAVASVVMLLAGCAAGPAKDPPSAPVVIGESQNCVLLQNIRQTRVIDDRTIDFIMRDGRVLRNNLPNRCPQLGFERAFSYSTSISQLCSVDIITVLQQGGGIRRGASCGLGQFTPIEPVKR